ncbi:hypothetical protein AB7Y93_22320 [Providencia manganoxydans]|uniref:hypothetical protein n=1 Tax=Providencia manganoxydans TaxID=2923283 RepID=UPI0034E49D1F
MLTTTAATTEEHLFTDELTVRQIQLKLNDEKLINQYASSYLWNGYRGHSTLPYLLQCALMALENWLIDYISRCGEKNQIDWIFDYLLRNSNSVMITSVLASVAVGFPIKVKKSAFPMLNTAELYSLDLTRIVHEMGENTPHWFGYNKDVMTEIYIEERRKAALRAWRRESLETLLTRLQFNSELQEDALKIVDYLKIEATVRNERSLRYLAHRVDTRTWTAIDDAANNRILFESSSELPEDLKQDQQKFNERHSADSLI